MNYITKLLGMSALAAGLIPAAYAQEVEQDKEAVLGTVVVTAQFTEQNLQDTPIAITGFSGDMLESRGMGNVLDISAQSPNVTLAPGGAFSGPSLVAFIRGVGQTDFNPALEPGVGMYVDDVYYATLTGSVLDLLDLNRVEILRGPQGTLAGKNSIGGSIKLFSERPSDDPNGYVEVAYGDYDALKLRAASNFTLVEDKLWARVSGVSNSRSGYVDTYSYGCLFPGSGFPNQRLDAGCKTGADGDIDYSAARAALRWLASDTVEVNASVDFTDDNSGATANTLLGFGPTVAPVIVNGQLQWPTVAAVPFTPLDPSQFLATDPYVSYADYTDPRTGLVIPRDRIMQSTGASLAVDWALSDTLQLQSITGYRQYESSFAGDYDASPVPVAILYQTNTHEQYSQEVRLNGEVGDFAEWTVGGFYFKADTDLTGRIDLGYVGFDFIHGPDPVETTNWALFGNGIFHLTDQLVMSAGVRFSEDEKDYTFRRRNRDLGPIQPCLGPPGTPGNPPNCLISSLDGTNSVFSDDRLDYRASLSYSFTDDTMAYASYSTGYKGGGVNPRPFFNVQAEAFQPEDLVAYEIGAKTELFNNTLRLNGAVFFNEYTDVQLTLNDCTAIFGPVFGRPCLANRNAGDADVKGAEIEFQWAPIDGLSIDGSASMLDFEFTRLDPATGLSINGVPAFTPESSWSLGAQYDIQLPYGTVRPRVDVSYQDDVYGEANNTARNLIEAYTLVNGSIRWISPDEDWVLAVEGRNLTDELYYLSKIDSTPGLGGVVYGTPAMPRTFMVSVRRNF